MPGFVSTSLLFSGAACSLSWLGRLHENLAWLMLCSALVISNLRHWPLHLYLPPWLYFDCFHSKFKFMNSECIVEIRNRAWVQPQVFNRTLRGFNFLR